LEGWRALVRRVCGVPRLLSARPAALLLAARPPKNNTEKKKHSRPFFPAFIQNRNQPHPKLNKPKNQQAGIDASLTDQVLVEQSLIGWKEYELEVMRDLADNVVIVCSIENVDPMGVHTGDSITVAPSQTLTDREYQRLRDASVAIIREMGVECGGSNVQMAVNPEDGEVMIIEMNPRVSRSSALASKATGFPIAKMAAKLAVGYTLDQIANDITRKTPASFEPSIDYVVTKIRVREVPGQQGRADDADEECRRGHGDRAHVAGVAAEGASRHGERDGRVVLT
jgi:hypothetical protein